MKKEYIIAIDGPSGTGKTTVAREVARRLAFDYFETGAMYRALTYFLLRQNLPLRDEKVLQEKLPHFHFDIKMQGGKAHYFVGKEEVTEAIRSLEVTKQVSEVASHPEVRRHLVAIQREFGRGKRAVFEGRDIGTVVFPQAACKIFLTARADVRAKRRFLELKGQNVSEKDVLEAITKRDFLDSTRSCSPLKEADDAHIIDTSDLTLEEVIQKVLACIS